MEKLTQINIDGTATIMSNRVKGCYFRKDKEMNRWDCDQFVRSDKKNCITKWTDNKSVLMISTAYETEPECVVQSSLKISNFANFKEREEDNIFLGYLDSRATSQYWN
ncbi:hypothetical protein JTB14_030566 [Gonioctena quinquepunctata]|nr:hypothetical protein JTB14_030566 [Gonioctena quinquepunctata]